MLQDIIGFFGDLTARQASLSSFSSAVEVATAANFGYSALFKLGKFSGESINSWAERETLRVLTAMAETPNFNGARFQRSIETLKNYYRRVIFRINCTAAIWAVIVAIAGVSILVLMPFWPAYPISGTTALICAVIGFGPIPIGMVVASTFHAIARIRMWRLQKKHDVVIEYIEPLPQVKEAREALKKRRSPNKKGAAKNRQ